MPADLAAWITPALVVAATALILRRMSILEDRLSARLDELNRNLGERIDALGKRLDTKAEAEEETPAAKRDLINSSYRAAYRERGNPNHCGDWLANELAGTFVGKDGKFSPDAFTDCLIANGVEMDGKWAKLPTSGQSGWQGRYRMNGRQKLERKVLANGFLTIAGVDVQAPIEWLDKMAGKLPKVVVKWELSESGEVVTKNAG